MAVRSVLVAALLAVTSALAGAGSTQAAPAPSQSTARSGFVAVRHLASLRTPRTATSAPATRAVRNSLPFRTLDPQALAAAKAAPRTSGTAVRGAASPSARLTAVTTAGPLQLVSHDSELSGFGQDIEPPDTQLAAGLTQLAEAVNDVLTITDKSGTLVVSADLNGFFGVDTAHGFLFGDPRIVYDAESGRWFISGFAFNPTTNSSEVLLAISTSGDASATYAGFLLDSDATHICDQPKLGVNTDKVTVSCANFITTTTFTNQSTFVLNKAELLGGGTVHGWRFDDPALFNPVPAVSLTPTTTAFMVENGRLLQPGTCGSTSTVLTAFTGVPSAATPAPTPANRSDVCLPMGATAIPPGAAQPAGGVPTIATNDDRFLSATWQNGLLWTGGNDRCIPAGDSSARSCMRLESITTAAPALSSVEVGRNGFDEYFPAVTLDPIGDVFVSFTTSNGSTFASTAVVTMAAGSSTPDSPVILQAGSAAYQDDLPLGQSRWGDYSGAAPDPLRTGGIWVTGEYAKTGVNSALRSWATATAEVSEAPQAASITAASGSAVGGDSVHITGSFFEPGATVSFAGHLATSVVVAPDGRSITATTPSGAVGAATVTVTNPDGNSASVPGGFTYTAPAATGTTFFFAEGNTLSGFDETLQLFTPNSSGNAQVTYFTETGSVGPISHALTAGQVMPVSVVGDVGAGHTGVSASVVLPGPGVAQRQLHFTIGNWHGSTDKVGVTGAAAEWDFAEGSTLSFFSEFLTLQNPDPATDSNVTIDYFTDQGAKVVKTITLPHASRTTVEVFNGSLADATCAISAGVAQSCGVGQGVGGVSTQVLVTSGPAIIAERPFFVNGFSFGPGPIRDGHVAFGANGPNASWNFAEGTTIAGFNEYLTLQNPGLTASNVTIKYFTDSGQTVTRTLALRATSRTTLDVTQGNTAAGPTACVISAGVAQSCGVGPGVGGVSTSVTVTSGPNVVAERPMYLFHDFGTGAVAGATVVVGANSLGQLFGFAGSQTTTGQNDYLTIQNPNAQAATLTISYYDAAGGFPRTATVVVAPNTRQTVEVFAVPSSNSGSVGAGFSNLGIVVSSNQPVLVERPTYSSIAAQYGATDTLGFTPIPAF